MSAKELMMLVPMRTKKDYRAALDRMKKLSTGTVDEIESAADNDDDDETHEEVQILGALIEEFETRNQVDTDDVDDDDDFEEFYRLPDPENIPLATFQLSNGSEIRLIGNPEEDEIAVVEIAESGSEDFLLDDRSRPATIFQRLSTSKSPVPRMIQRLDKSGLFDGREIVDQLSAPVSVSLDELRVQPMLAAVGSGSCQPGAAGAAYFKSHHCGSGGGPGYGKSESHCFENSFEWLQKTSSSRRRTTYTRMAACGSGSSRVRHQYKKSSGWHTQLSITVEPGKVVSYWSAKGGIKRKRRVRFESVGSGGWVRGWVKYHNQIAGGWF